MKYAQIVWDGVKLDPPKDMGCPRKDQLQGSDRDNLTELSGRVCYDSLGSGRNSKDYHQHIADVGHGSVQEHANLTFAISVNGQTYYPCCEALLNRPGVWTEKTLGKTGLELRLTTNLRSIREWHRFNVSNFSQMLGDKIQFLAKSHAPLVMQDIEVKDNHFAVEVVDPVSENEKWVSVFFTKVSRGFSHELVRHKYKTAVSQRSTRYVDENESNWCWHPLVLKHADEAGELYKNTLAVLMQCEEVCKDAYANTVAVLQKFMTDMGVDKFTARKQARGAARGVLGNALMTELIFSASIAEWKWIFNMRASAHADAEIRVVMNEVYEQFVERFPESFSGYKKVECPDKIGYGLEKL
jgi:flavin-dependent thymidylate synthase